MTEQTPASRVATDPEGTAPVASLDDGPKCIRCGGTEDLKDRGMAPGMTYCAPCRRALYEEAKAKAVDYDITVTWRAPDGSTIDLPATVCYRDGRDDPWRRAEAITHAIEANIADFEDDIAEGAEPVAVRFADV